MHIIGYFIDANEEPTPSTIFVAVDIPEEVVSYSPVGQHGKLDLSYLDECKEISKELYVRYSNGIYTPEEYL